RTRQRARRQRRIQIGRVVGIDAEGVHEERAFVANECPAQAQPIVEILLGAVLRDERTSSAPSPIADSRLGEDAYWPDPRLCENFDGYAASAVVLRGKLVSSDADRPDHRLRGQGPSLEAVDPNHRSGPRHLL